jgi:hypothetical protein
MSPARIALGALAALLLVVGLFVVVHFLSDPLGLGKRKVATATTTATVATGKAAVADAKALTAADVAAIIDAARQRDHTTIEIREANRDAILKSPGADARLDPAFVGNLNRGLCRYAANAYQPGCASLLGSSPGELSDAGGGGGDIGP